MSGQFLAMSPRTAAPLLHAGDRATAAPQGACSDWQSSGRLPCRRRPRTNRAADALASGKLERSFWPCSRAWPRRTGRPWRGRLSVLQPCTERSIDVTAPEDSFDILSTSFHMKSRECCSLRLRCRILGTCTFAHASIAYRLLNVYMKHDKDKSNGHVHFRPRNNTR